MFGRFEYYYVICTTQQRCSDYTLLNNRTLEQLDNNKINN